MTYKLIADSGSTKTDWLLTEEDQTVLHIATQGINPFMLSEDEIVGILERELLPALQQRQVAEVEFYGAGCRGKQCDVVARALHRVLHPVQVVVDSDMLGAARALCGSQEGIVCILGTGSNSCLYNGHRIVENVSPLGYILGDEGSGAVLGRRFIGDLLKEQLPEALRRDFAETYGLTSDEIIQHVYREQYPNRFLASFAPFIYKHKSQPGVRDMLLDEFVRFFTRNVSNYHRPDLPVSFVGSVAYYFQEELQIAARQCGYRILEIRKAPLGKC